MSAKNRKRLVTAGALTLAVLITIFSIVFWPLGSVPSAFAEELSLTYNTDSYNSSGLSRYPTLTTNTITLGKAGYRIKSAKVVDGRNGSVVQTITAAAGQTSWSGTVTLSGIEIPVTSKGNQILTYYAWYRYSAVNSDWYADVTYVHDDYRKESIVLRCPSQKRSDDPTPLPPKDTSGRWVYPGCMDNRLSFSSGVKEPFYTPQNMWVENSVVDPTRVTGTIGLYKEERREYWIPGPLGTRGPSDPTTRDMVVLVDKTRPLEEFSVRYTQVFDHVPPGDSVRDLEAKGAQLMVFFAGFVIDLHSYTYFYPYKLVVEYEPVGGASPSPSPTATPKLITGDFDVIPSTIQYRDSFTLRPKNIRVQGCVYRQHQFKFERGGLVGYSNLVRSPTQDLVMTYNDYMNMPVIAAGTHNVYMEIQATCGGQTESVWVGPKLLTVTEPPNNNPPFMKIGWFRENDTSAPVPKVVAGTRVDLRVIEDPEGNPPSPSDPDGDPITWTWDFAGSPSAWVRSLPERYGLNVRDEWVYRGLLADTVGTHTIRATVKDRFGASYTATAVLEVIPPNPVAVPDCPPEVKENRPVPANAFRSDRSYSPVGRPIDHSRDEWTNRRSSYTNGTSGDITVQVGLHVYDSEGLRSIEPGTCSIIVHPDLPPQGRLEVPPLGLRNQTYTVWNRSSSPDGDRIVSAEYRYKYDVANNGFADDTWQPLAGDLAKASFAPTQVGKYLFDVRVCEDYGRCAWASETQDEASRTLDTTNQRPSVSFEAAGQNPQPDLNPPVSYAVADILNNWSLYATNTTRLPLARKTNWYVENGRLVSGLGKTEERLSFRSVSGGGGSDQYFDAFQDFGFGMNNLSSYRLPTSAQWSAPILVYDRNGLYMPLRLSPGADKPPNVQTDRTHIYFVAEDPTYNVPQAFYAWNKNKQPRYTYTVNWQNPYNPVYTHMYDGNPYDYVLRPGVEIPSRQMEVRTYYSYQDYQRNRYSYSQTIPVTPKIEDFVVADKVLYLVVSYTWEYAIVYDSGSTSRYTRTAYEVIAYDALSGTRLGGTYDASARPEDHLLDAMQFFGYQNQLYGFSRTYAAVFDRSGRLTRRVEIPVLDPNVSKITPNHQNCGVGTSPWQKDGLGGFYRYETASCYNEYNTFDYNSMKTYLVKVNGATLQVAWRTLLNGRSSTPYGFGRQWQEANGVPYDYFPYVLFDPINQQVVARSFTSQGFDTFSYYQRIRMDSGGIEANDPGDAYGYLDPWGVRWDGSRGTPAVVQAPDGSYLSRGSGCTGYTVYRPNGNATCLGDRSGDPLRQGYLWMEFTGGSYFAMPAGDGLVVTFHKMGYGSWAGGGEYKTPMVVYVHKGSPTTEPLLRKPIEFGQFVSPDSIDNHELSWTMSLSQPNVDRELAGMSFRMRNPTNRYAVETDGETLYLSRYVDGARTVLAQTRFPVQPDQEYTFRVKLTGSRIEVFVDGVPYFDVTDGTFASGKFGPFTDKPFVGFKGITAKKVNLNTVEWLTGYAIWENGQATVRYDNVRFSDPENDPRAGDYRWTYTHTPKFLDNQGVSVLSGRTFTSEQVVFDKVGVYDVTLQARDDPHPNYRYPSGVFDGYRKLSDPFTRRVVVHRRPVAAFTLSTAPNGVIQWNDTSYDPDRYQPSTNTCDAPENGIDYCATRGIMERKYWYVTPSGQYVEGKLTRPQEAGTYTVGMAVKDEYGAWSNPVETTITSAGNVPPNTPPAASLTFPTGTETNPTLVYDTQPTISWTQTDPDPGTTFRWFQVKIEEPMGDGVFRTVPLVGEQPQWTTSNNASWRVPVANVLERGKKYRVQVRVSDGEQWSAWSNVGWLVVNSAPSVVITDPNGTEGAPTIIPSDRRPTIRWTQTDPERNVFKRFELEIRNASGQLVYSKAADQNVSGTSGSHRVETDLPTGERLSARVRVSDDGDLWSPWSNTVYFLINFPPAADLTFPSGTYANPTVAGTTPTIRWTQTDPDPNTVFTKYRVLIERENGAVVHDSGEVFQNRTETAGSHAVTSPLPAGVKLKVRVMVWDQYTNSPWSVERWMITNRPPQADFDWTPNPAYEGDTITLTNRSTDPDGDTLTASWTVTAPDGTILVQTSTWDASIAGSLTVNKPGAYTVTLTVRDPQGATATITKTIQVAALTVSGRVEHTPEWNEHRMAYNRKKSGNPEAPRPYEAFWAGERFILKANTTLTGTSTKANTVTVRMGSFRVTLTPNASHDSWYGEMYDGSFNYLPDGPLTFLFEARYSNGVVKQDVVTVRIVGNYTEYFRLHRTK